VHLCLPGILVRSAAGLACKPAARFVLSLPVHCRRIDTQIAGVKSDWTMAEVLETQMKLVAEQVRGVGGTGLVL